MQTHTDVFAKVRDHERSAQLAAARLPMFGDAFQPAAQPRREKIDRFSRCLCLDLSADKPAIDVEIGLRDHRPRHRRIVMPAQFDVGLQHRSAGVPTELADLGTRVFRRFRKLIVRCHVNVDGLWQIRSVVHTSVLHHGTDY